MSTFSDTPTSEGATNVALNQRASSAPYRREEVNLQGDENPGRAIGFDQNGRLATLEVDENPFATVDTEAQFDAALAAGRSILIRGEGAGGTVALTTPKNITSRFTTIKSDAGAVLSFTLPQPVGINPCGLTLKAPDITLQNFELTSTQAVATNTCFGIFFTDDVAIACHRLRLLDMHIHNWCRCIAKDSPNAVIPAEDILIDRLYAHTFRDYGIILEYGIHRLVMRDSRVIGKLAGEVHTTNNALHGGIRWEDNTFLNCVFANVDMIGFEATLGGYQNYHRRTHLYGCRAENCGWMGFSTMFGTGILIDKCVAKNVKGCGFEIGGRPPEQVPPVPNDPAYYRYGQGIFDSCVVDGVTPSIYSVGQAKGISIDGAEDTVVRGSTFIRNVHSDEPDGSGAAGVDVTNSERCSVMDGTFVDAGHACIFFAAGLTPNTRGFHEAVGNTFRNSAGALPHYGVWVANTTVSVRDNTTWQKSGTSLTNKSNTEAPAKTIVDGSPVANGIDVPFTGSNIILPC